MNEEGGGGNLGMISATFQFVHNALQMPFQIPILYFIVLRACPSE